MADKMWDILSFLRTPPSDNSKEKKVKDNVEEKLKEINAQLEDAMENPGREKSPPPSGETAPQRVSAPIRGRISMSDIGLEAPSIEKSREETRIVHREEIADPRTENPPSEERLIDIPVSSVRSNPFQPRKELGEQEIKELSDSIKEFGILQPILVKRAEDGYELVAGERRLRATIRAGLAKIPAVVVEAEPLNQQIMALVENIQRKDLSSVEEAISLQDILAKTGWSQSELSRRMGRSQASIANKLRLLRLDPEVQAFVLSGKLGERQARSLLSLSPDDQRMLAQKTVDEDLSVREIETLAENWNNKPPARRAKTKRGGGENPGGELLGDVAALVGKHRDRGLAAQWKVKQMNQSSLVVEITVDLMKNHAEEATSDEDL